jgi:peroxin-16
VLGVVNEHVAPAADGDPACARAAAAPTPAAPHLPWSLWVAVLHQLEVLAEMSAERALGADGKWSVLAGLEAAKALLRLTALRRSGGRILVGDAVPSARAPPWALAAQRAAADAELAGRLRAESTLRALAAFRRGRALTACSGPAALTGAPAMPRMLACAPPLAPAVRLHVASPGEARHERQLLLAGESLRILRPVVYCLAVRRFGRRSWKAWLASLAMDLGRRAPRDVFVPGQR